MPGRNFTALSAFVIVNSAMYEALSDAQITALVAACQRGETAALEELYNLYADRLYRYLLTRVADPDLAAELTTELFLRVIEHIGRFRLDPDHPAAAFSAWLYRIAANLVAAYHRTQRRRPMVSLEEGCQDQPGPGPLPEQAAQAQEELTALAQAMETLSEEQRLVLVGRFIEAMSVAQVAAWLGKSEGAVKALQHRALRTLARVLKAQDGQTQVLLQQDLAGRVWEM
jgi:RNA polymerase sigma-70 factor (ECF subfamily)